MKRKTMTLSLFALLGASLALGACAPKQSIDANALSGVMTPVLDRHDAYVAGDDSLDATQKEIFLRSSGQLRSTVDEALDEDN